MLKPPKKFLVPYLLLLEVPVHTYIWQCGIPQLIILKKALNPLVPMDTIFIRF